MLRSELARHDLDEIVGKHPAMDRLHALIAQVARTSTTVLITGESGTGKELIARAIHRRAAAPRGRLPRSIQPPSESLIESELFGHERGVHRRPSAARQVRASARHLRNLDEIGMPRAEPVRGWCPRVLQEREIERVAARGRSESTSASSPPRTPTSKRP